MSDNEKTKVNTSPAVDVEVGTAEDVDAIMKKYDRESNVRIWEGTPKFAIRILLAVFALFMVWMNMFATWDERFRPPPFRGNGHYSGLPSLSYQKGKHPEKFRPVV